MKYSWNVLLNRKNLNFFTTIRQKDEVAGEVPVAFVVRSKDFEITEESVKEFIAKQVWVYINPSLFSKLQR